MTYFESRRTKLPLRTRKSGFGQNHEKSTSNAFSRRRSKWADDCMIHQKHLIYMYIQWGTLISNFLGPVTFLNEGPGLLAILETKFSPPPPFSREGGSSSGG